MYLIILSLILLTAAYIGYEDCKFRAVSWVLFPILGALGVSSSIMLSNSYTTALLNFTVNLTFLTIQLAVLFLYLNYKKKNNRAFTKKIGAGDIFFLLMSAFFFSPLNFLFYLISSLVFALIVHLLFLKVKLYPQNLTTIPLAGLQAVFLILCLLTSKIALQINITDDSWILYKLLIA